MLRGERNAKTLYDKGGVDIWNRNAYQQYLKNKNLTNKIKKNTPEWENSFLVYQENMKSPDFNLEDADLGPIYGYQWRNFNGSKEEGSDQLVNLINGIKKDRGSRYHILSAWNPLDLKKMSLPPCHCFTQFTVTRDKDLDVNMYQRSCDAYLGVPFNIMQYALLNHMVAQEAGLVARKFIHSYGNVHIYGGLAPRTDFLKNEENLGELQEKIKQVHDPQDFLAIKEWYVQNAPPEDKHNERKDHIPFVLEQLSKTPGKLPSLEITPLPFFDLINQPVKEVTKLIGGDKQQQWNSKAVMAA